MLTNRDITKLKTIFATKEDLKRFATKKDLKRFATKEDLKDFPTKNDPKGFATKNDLKGFATQKGQEEIIEGIKTIIEIIGKEKVRNDEQDSILDNHERRFDKLEDKVFSSN